MFRNQYDNDVSVWSPHGRIFQVEYAMESVDMGTACVGLKSNDFVVILGLYRSPLAITLSQSKLIDISDYVGVCVAGITSDSRNLAHYLRAECSSFNHLYGAAHPIKRLATKLAVKMQVNTQRYDRRPHGVGFLMAGHDSMGNHLYQIMPSANFFNCKAMAIGYRSQGARTYLMKHVDEFSCCSKDELICHGIQAISFAGAADEPLKVCIGIVGKDHPFKQLNEVECLSYQKTCKPPDMHDMDWYPNALREFDSSAESAADNAPGPSAQRNETDTQPNNDVTPNTSKNQVNNNKSNST